MRMVDYMYCIECGSKISNKASFCPLCGKEMTKPKGSKPTQKVCTPPKRKTFKLDISEW